MSSLSSSSDNMASIKNSNDCKVSSSDGVSPPSISTTTANIQQQQQCQPLHAGSYLTMNVPDPLWEMQRPVQETQSEQPTIALPSHSSPSFQSSATSGTVTVISPSSCPVGARQLQPQLQQQLQQQEIQPQYQFSGSTTFIASSNQFEPSILIVNSNSNGNTASASLTPPFIASTITATGASNSDEKLSNNKRSTGTASATAPYLKKPRKYNTNDKTDIKLTTMKTTAKGNASPTALSSMQQPESVSASEQKQQQQEQQPVVLTEKKLRRLEKNRLSARECRRRKREAAETMLEEIHSLEAENVQLRLQLRIGQEAEHTVHQEQTKLTAEIDTLLKSGEASEADIYSTLEEFKEKYADYGHSRRSSIEYHLQQIAQLLLPTQTTSVVMHAMTNISSSSNAFTNSYVVKQEQQPEEEVQLPSSSVVVAKVESATCTALPSAASDIGQLNEQGSSSTSVVASTDSLLPSDSALYGASSSSSSAVTASQIPRQKFDPKQLFSFLAQYLEVSHEQAVALKDSRFVAQEMDSCLERTLSVLNELRDRLTKTGNDLETEFNNIRSILTPSQAAKFLVWVANNSVCMHMLNELWDRVYPTSS